MRKAETCQALCTADIECKVHFLAQFDTQANYSVCLAYMLAQRNCGMQNLLAVCCADVLRRDGARVYAEFSDKASALHLSGCLWCNVLRKHIATAKAVFHASCLRMLRVPNPSVPCQIVGVSCAPTLNCLILCVCMRKAMRNTSHKTRMINRAHAVILQAIKYTACQYNATTPLQIGLSPYFTPPELGNRCAFIQV